MSMLVRFPTLVVSLVDRSAYNDIMDVKKGASLLNYFARCTQKTKKKKTNDAAFFLALAF
jgi:hypothetical protein